VILPGRDCMTEDRMTTHGWGACTSVERTRAPSMGDAIERTIDSTRLSQEKSSLGQNRVTVYFPSRLLHSSHAAEIELPKGRCKDLTPRTTVIVLGENNPRKGKSAPVPSSLSNRSNYDVVTPNNYFSKALVIGVEKGHNSTRKEFKTHGTTGGGFGWHGDCGLVFCAAVDDHLDVAGFGVPAGGSGPAVSVEITSILRTGVVRSRRGNGARVCLPTWHGVHDVWGLPRMGSRRARMFLVAAGNLAVRWRRRRAPAWLSTRCTDARLVGMAAMTAASACWMALGSSRTYTPCSARPVALTALSGGERCLAVRYSLSPWMMMSACLARTDAPMSVRGNDGTTVALGNRMECGTPGSTAGPCCVPRTTFPVAVPIRRRLLLREVRRCASALLRKTPAAPVSMARFACVDLARGEGCTHMVGSRLY
jgi:hypothetical protein